MVFRASRFLLERIEILTAKKNVAELSAEELQELQDYEELSNYLTWVNRTIALTLHYPLQGTVDRYDDPFEPAVPLAEWETLKFC